MSSADNYEPEDEMDPVTLDCQFCGEPVERMTFGDFHWEHVGDEITMAGQVLLSTSKFDHPAVPDVIDVLVVDSIDPVQ